jgi:hypothetical protein
LADPRYRADIEADAWRFYRWWLDLDEDLWPDLPSSRIVEMLERLPAMDGALTARAALEAQESGGTGSQTVSGVPVGRGASQSGGSGSSEVEHVESTGRTLTGHPAFAGLVEYVKV